MNMANIPKPKRRAARLVDQTAGIRIMVMSTTGDSERTSAQTQRAVRTMVTAKSPRTVALAQPQVGPSETATRPVTNQDDMKRAPSQLIRPGARTGDSGTKRKVATVARSVMTRGIQKSQW